MLTAKRPLMLPIVSRSGIPRSTLVVSRSLSERFMKTLTFSIVVVLGALLRAQAGNPFGPVVFERARLLNGTGSPPVEDSVFVVENGHFTVAGPRASTKVPANATHVNLAGKTVMPGMINAHVHIGYEGYTTWR